jgi:hypothetical protein
MDCGLQSSQIQHLERTTRGSLLDQLARELPNYEARLSKAQRILSKSSPIVGKPFRTFLRQFGWHFKKQVLGDLLSALQRGNSSFVIILQMASLWASHFLCHVINAVVSMTSSTKMEVPVPKHQSDICTVGVYYPKRRYMETRPSFRGFSIILKLTSMDETTKA